MPHQCDANPIRKLPVNEVIRKSLMRPAYGPSIKLASSGKRTRGRTFATSWRESVTGNSKSASRVLNVSSDSARWRPRRKDAYGNASQSFTEASTC